MINQPTNPGVTRLAFRHDEAAESLGVSPRTLFSWVNDPDSDLPVIRRRGVNLYPIKELEMWLSNHLVDTGE